MAEALPKVRSAPHPLPFVIKADVIDVEQACDVWRSAKIHRLEEFVATIVENTLISWDIVYQLTEEIPFSKDISFDTDTDDLLTCVSKACLNEGKEAALGLMSLPDSNRKLIKLIQLQIECSKLQSTLLSMGESLSDIHGRLGQTSGRKEPLLSVMCGNGYDRAAQAFLEAASVLEKVIHAEGKRTLQSDLIEAWKLGHSMSNNSVQIQPGHLLKSLLEHQSHPRGYRPLHLSALHGRDDFCSLLLAYGAQVDGQDRKGRSALYWALKTYKEDIALMLLEHGATVNDRDFAVALERLYPDVVRKMLKRKRCSPNIIRVSNRKGRSLSSLGDLVTSPLKIVIEAKYKKTRKKAEVKLGDTSDEYLRVAMTRLFEDDDDLDPRENIARRSTSSLPLHDDLDADELGTFGGDLSDEQESFRRKTEIMSLLLDAGADVNCRDTRRSPLLAAAQKGDETLLEWLQINGGDLDITFSNGYYDNVMGNVGKEACLLHFASHNVIPLLIYNGVDANHKDADGRTPFYTKAKAGCIPSMKELIHHEPLLNINSQTHKEKTALHVLLVKMSSSPKMLDFVMDQAFEPSLTVDEDGWTVLFFAAVLGSIDLCRSLLIKGARADVKDVFGNYPFVYALVAHNFPCATVLVHQLMHRFPRRWVSDLSSLDNISVIERKVKSVFKGIHKDLYEPLSDADDEDPYITATCQPLLHLTLTHGYLHALEDPLNSLVSRHRHNRDHPHSLSRVRAVFHLLQTLLQRGYDPNLASVRNETALGLLLSMRHWHRGLDVPSTVLLLLQYGADATVVDPRGRNLIDLTLRAGDLEDATYVYLCGATLKPKHLDKIHELEDESDPHVPDSETDETSCPYFNQPCLSCIVTSPLSLKSLTRIVIRRQLGSSLAHPECQKQLCLPRELHRYLYLGDVLSVMMSSGCDCSCLEAVPAIKHQGLKEWFEGDFAERSSDDNLGCSEVGVEDEEPEPAFPVGNDRAYRQFLETDFPFNEE